MNVTVETLAPCRKLIRVEVPPDQVEAAFQAMTQQFQREARLPGFRPGKAPKEMVARAYGSNIEGETKRKLISDSYRQAIKDEKIDVLGYPDIEEIQFGRNMPLQFAATVETFPQFELPDYMGLSARRDTATVTDADVERALDVLRQQKVSYRDVTRPAQPGDIAVVNYSGTSEGRPLTDIAPTARGLTKQSNFWVEIKRDSFIPGFTEQLEGLTAGAKKTVNVTFPEGFVAPALSGRPGAYEVEIMQIKEKVLPELDDAFAAEYGAENMEKLRAGVRVDLDNELKYKQKREVRNQLIGSLLDKARFDLPESMVQQETKNVVYDIVRENQQRGVPKEKIEEQKDQIYSLANNSARERVRATFILNRIAEKEGIQVSQQEITQRILQIAAQNDIKPDKLVKQLQERNGLAEIHQQILTSKVFDFLELNAKIEEGAGGGAAADPATTA